MTSESGTTLRRRVLTVILRFTTAERRTTLEFRPWMKR